MRDSCQVRERCFGRKCHRFTARRQAPVSDPKCCNADPAKKEPTWAGKSPKAGDQRASGDCRVSECRQMSPVFTCATYFSQMKCSPGPADHHASTDPRENSAKNPWKRTAAAPRHGGYVSWGTAAVGATQASFVPYPGQAESSVRVGLVSQDRERTVELLGKHQARKPMRQRELRE